MVLAVFVVSSAWWEPLRPGLRTSGLRTRTLQAHSRAVRPRHGRLWKGYASPGGLIADGSVVNSRRRAPQRTAGRERPAPRALRWGPPMPPRWWPATAGWSPLGIGQLCALSESCSLPECGGERRIQAQLWHWTRQGPGSEAARRRTALSSDDSHGPASRRCGTAHNSCIN